MRRGVECSEEPIEEGEILGEVLISMAGQSRMMHAVDLGADHPTGQGTEMQA